MVENRLNKVYAILKKVIAINKTIAAIMAIVLLCPGLSGCYDSVEIDELAYVIGIGLDKGKTNFLKMTFQIAVPRNIGGGSGQGGGAGGEGGGGNETVTVTTLESPSIYSGLNMANTYISKKLNMSHAKILVFSEELAREGIHKYIHAIIRGKEFRPNMFLVVSRESAEKYLRDTKPLLEVNPAKYYEMNYRAFEYTAFTANTQLINFYLQEECTCSQAVATLANTSRYKSSEEYNLQGSTYPEKGRAYPFEGDFKAGDMPKTGEMKTEIMGLAVFDGDKMAGELDGEETMFYLMLTGQYKYAYVTIPDPYEENQFVLLNIKQSRMPSHDAAIVGERPEIKASIRLEADILSIQSGYNYESPENVSILEKKAEEFIKTGMTKFLYKTSKEFKSDICGFGKALKAKYLTWDKWDRANWLGMYKDSVFSVDVELKIRRTGLMIRTTPAYSTKGKELK